MKPRVAKRNMPAAMYCLPPVLPPLMVATSTIDPRLPSIGIAFIRTPLAPSDCSICGGGCSCSWPVGSSGSSSRPPRSGVADGGPADSSGSWLVVVTFLPGQSLAGPSQRSADDRRGANGGNYCLSPDGRAANRDGVTSDAEGRRSRHARAHRARPRGRRRPRRPTGGLGRRRLTRVRRAVPPAVRADPAHPHRRRPRGRRSMLDAGVAHRRPAGRGRRRPWRDASTCAVRPRSAPPAPLAAFFCVAVGAAGLAGWFAARTDDADHQQVTIALLGLGAFARRPPGRAGSRPPAGRGAGVRRRRRVRRRLGARAPAAADRGRRDRAGRRRRRGRGARDGRAGRRGAPRLDRGRAGALPGDRGRRAAACAARGGVGVLLLLATLAARFVPGLAVDVPDQYLIDLERLAVTAWSARERPTGRRGPDRRPAVRGRRRGRSAAPGSSPPRRPRSGGGRGGRPRCCSRPPTSRSTGSAPG